jgi:outer membrane murein-binding lipoprotein Lpp
MLTKEDLQSIENLLDRKLGFIQSDVSTLKSDVSTLKSDVSTLKSDVSSLKSDVSTLKSDMADVKDRVSNLEQDMKVVKVDLLENNVIPRLDHIENCYMDTSKRYMKDADKFENAITDIEIMKLAIQRNSADILELKKKQA